MLLTRLENNFRPYSISVAVSQIPKHLLTTSSAIAETARITIRSVIAVERLTLTVKPYVNFISLTDLPIRKIMYPVIRRSMYHLTNLTY